MHRSVGLGNADGWKATSSSSRRRDSLRQAAPYFHKVGVAPLDGVCSTDIVVVAPGSRDGLASSSLTFRVMLSSSTRTRARRERRCRAQAGETWHAIDRHAARTGRRGLHGSRSSCMERIIACDSRIPHPRRPARHAAAQAALRRNPGGGCGEVNRERLMSGAQTITHVGFQAQRIELERGAVPLARHWSRSSCSICRLCTTAFAPCWSSPASASSSGKKLACAKERFAAIKLCGLAVTEACAVLGSEGGRCRYGTSKTAGTGSADATTSRTWRGCTTICSAKRDASLLAERRHLALPSGRADCH